MISFFSKKSRITNFQFPIEVDMHSHIIPGIDDGSPDIETSLELIKGLMKLGIKRSIATPHIIGDMYRNSADTIFPALQGLQLAIENEGLDFEVSAAAEYMMDNYFFELLDNKTVLLTVKDNYILTEFSYSSMPSYPEKMSFAILTEGYQPILAHPERYGYYFHDHKQFKRLKELGFHLQLNLLSLTGLYGKETKLAAEYMLKHELYSFVGTDLHHVRHLQALSEPSNLKLFDKLLGSRFSNQLV